MPLPLSHITVLDLTRVRSGPTCVRQLADWGANCIKIEAPDEIDTGKGMGGERHGPDFQNVHRNKRGITLNLKHPDGLALFRRMVAKADVVVENYRPDVKDRLGINYEALSAINPRIVLGSISGGAFVVQYFGIQHWAQSPFGLVAMLGLAFACGLPAWAVVRWVANYLERRRDADIAAIAAEVNRIRNGGQ